MNEAPASSVAIPHPLGDVAGAPRPLTRGTKIGVLLSTGALALSCLVIAVFAPVFGRQVATSHLRAAFLPSVQVSAVVISSTVRWKMRDHGRRVQLWDVVAEATVDGKSVYAPGTFETPIEVGASVNARVPKANPDLAWVVNDHALAEGEVTLAFGALLIAFGGVVVAAIRRNRRFLYLLQFGRPAMGRRVGKVVEKGQQPTWLLTWEYPTEQGPKTVSVRIPEHEAGRLVDEDFEPLLYDPLAPERAFVLDALPDKLRVVGGQITPMTTQRVLLRAIAPTLAVVGVVAGVAMAAWPD
jgi:hypothetical protein